MAADERVAVVDRDDRVVGDVSRAEMRARRLRHRATFILVFDERGRLLVHQRTATKDVYPGYYDVCVGGVVLHGETYDASAARELAEEIGGAAPLQPVGPFRYDAQACPVNGMLYTCVWTGPLRLQAEEITQAEWLTLEELAARRRRDAFCPDGLAALDHYLAGR